MEVSTSWKYWWKWGTSLNSRANVPKAEELRHIFSQDCLQPLIPTSCPFSWGWGHNRIWMCPFYSLPVYSSESPFSFQPCCNLSSFSKKIKFLSVCHHSSLQWEMEVVAYLKENWQGRLLGNPKVLACGRWISSLRYMENLPAFPTLFIISFNCCLCFQNVVLGIKTSLLAGHV